MASNYTKKSSVNGSSELTTGNLSDILMQQTQDESSHSVEKGQGAPVLGRKTNHDSSLRSSTITTSNDQRKSNEVSLIRNRRIGSNQHMRRQMELLCEDIISKHKHEEIHCSLPSSIKSTFIMTFSPDGRRVASTHGDHRIYICDLNTGKLLDTLEGHPKTPWCLAWHPINGDILASGCLSGEVRVWDLKSRACESWTSDNHTIITSLDFHPKERVLVIATANDILFWDWSESVPFAKTTTMHDREKVKFVVFDSSGTKLITGISNLPKYAGYSSDSLQNRIIDGYLTQGTIDPLPTENMTHTSEIAASPVTGTNNLNENFNGREANSTSNGRRVDGVSSDNLNNEHGNANEQDVNYRNTMLLSRVAYLYRQLESMEDSMRHTGFAPLMNTRSNHANSSPQSSNNDNLGAESVNRNCHSNHGAKDTSNGTTEQPKSNESTKTTQPPTHDSPIQGRHDSAENPHIPVTPIANSFEPYIVTFDESLEQIQLQNLIIDGRSVDLTTVIDQYPVDLSRHLYHAMQFESVNQVNQNFIRISKLMCSSRLFRQVVQQILSNSSGTGPHQPNQILTAQSVSQRSSRAASNVPIVLRNFPLVPSEPSDLMRSDRTHDPVMAIEFRNTARNVPLTSICKIDLLTSRTFCILRAQHLVEQAIENIRPLTSTTYGPPASTSTGSTDRSPTDISLESVLGELHSTLTTINHAPLTTSNAYSHITTLRLILDRLLKMFTGMLRSAADGRRLGDLMHNIAFSLTNRRWSLPLGGTLDEIRLDVIHTLCIADLTLHFVRQVQLLQMQRISIITRVDESRRQISTQTIDPIGTTMASVSMNSPQMDSTSSTVNTPSTSTDTQSQSKRKGKPVYNDSKRRRVDLPSSASATMDTSETRSSSTSEASGALDTQTVDSSIDPNDQSPGVDRMLIWNGAHNPIEQSLQRFFVATTSSMNNSHILVRVYHRHHGMPPLSAHQGSMAEPQVERFAPQMESRRRALSQDNSINPSDSIDTISSAEAPPVRSRIRPPAALHVNLLSPNPNLPAPAGLALDAWQRHPHLHVYQTRGVGHHLWFNQWTIPLPMNHSNYRIQCWNFSRGSVPCIKNAQMRIITHKCRIHNDSSIDLSSNGTLIACLVPRDDGPACFPSFDLKIFSLRSYDFGTCYYRLPQGPNALSVSFSPSGSYAVVGLATLKSMSYEQTDDDLTIGKVFNLSNNNSSQFVRDIKIKRDDSSMCLNAIKWMPRGIVYSVGPQHLQRYQTARMRNVVAS